MRTTCPYETDVTDAQWELLYPLLPTPTWTPGSRGRPPRPLRRVVNGMLYVNKTGCQWRMLPKDFGPWETVYGYFRRWRQAGVWERVMTELRHLERRCQGRLAEPSAGAIDSQSVKLTPYGRPRALARCTPWSRRCIRDTPAWACRRYILHEIWPLRSPHQ